MIDPLVAGEAFTLSTTPSTIERSAMGTHWELAADEKRGTFVVRTYLPNYLLPVHVTNRLPVPQSPTHPAPDPNSRHYSHTEAKFQISLRTKILQDAPLLGGDVWLGYTQVSFWQLYDKTDSRSFRTTDYEPDIVYVVSLADRPWATLPGGWKWRMVQLGAGHQSNGANDPLSRSWNRAFAGTAFENGGLGIQMRAEQRVLGGGDDDNPDLTRYIGNAQLLSTWVSGPVVAAFTWRTRLGSMQRGSMQLDWTYPVQSSRPSGLRWYVQAFHGFGESLVNYNQRQTSFGAGVSLFQF